LNNRATCKLLKPLLIDEKKIIWPFFENCGPKERKNIQKDNIQRLKNIYSVNTRLLDYGTLKNRTTLI